MPSWSSNSSVIIASKEIVPVAKSVHKKLLAMGLDCDFLELDCETFPNGELKPRILKSIRRKEVYIFDSLFYPDVNTALIRLLFTINAVALAAPKSITLSLPYIPYSRQDRKDEPRVPISAKVVAKKILQSHKKVERGITFDLHCEQIQGFFSIPVDNLYGALAFSGYFKDKFAGRIADLVAVAPDFGAANRTRRFAMRIDPDMPVFAIDKRRGKGGTEIMNFNGDVAGKIVIIPDDMIDTGGTTRGADDKMLSLGALEVYNASTHGIFSTKKGVRAEDKLRDSRIHTVITDSIPRSADYLAANADWLTVISIVDLLATAIYESATVGGSISSLFAD